MSYLMNHQIRTKINQTMDKSKCFSDRIINPTRILFKSFMIGMREKILNIKDFLLESKIKNRIN